MLKCEIQKQSYKYRFPLSFSYHILIIMEARWHLGTCYCDWILSSCNWTFSCYNKTFDSYIWNLCCRSYFTSSVLGLVSPGDGERKGEEGSEATESTGAKEATKAKAMEATEAAETTEATQTTEATEAKKATEEMKSYEIH